MANAFIVSTAREPIGKAYCGALDNTDGASMLGEAIRAAVTRAGVDPNDIEPAMPLFSTKTAWRLS